MPGRKTPPIDQTPVEELFNLSDLTGGRLRVLEITNYGELCRADLHAVWLELKTRHKQVSKLMFYALWGAVNNVHWKQIPPEVIQNFDNWRNTL